MSTDQSKTIAIVCIALEAVGNRDPGAISPAELLAAIRKAMPDAALDDLMMAAEFLKRLNSRLKGAAWLVDPGNVHNSANSRHRHTPARTDGRAREAEGDRG